MFGIEIERGFTIRMEEAMRSIGIICEYNPFHNGHLRQLRLAREQAGEDCALICLMSGNYVQRGEPALFPKSLRAEAALRCGADLVLELPLTAALSSAEGFAAGGVRILSALGCDALCFGTETEDLAALRRSAEANLDPAFDALLRRELESGSSYAAARQRALTALGAGEGVSSPNDILAVEYLKALLRQNSPMQPLPIRRPGSYHAREIDAENPSATALRAALSSDCRGGHRPPEDAAPARRGEHCSSAPADPLCRGGHRPPEDATSARRGEHCSSAPADPPCRGGHRPPEDAASARRGEHCSSASADPLCRGGHRPPADPAAFHLCHSERSEESAPPVPISRHSERSEESASPVSMPVWASAVPSCLYDLYENAPLHTWQAGERAALAILRTLPEAAFRELPFGAEGLWSKLMKNCRRCASTAEILENTVSKRYTRARVQRMLLCAVLGLRAGDLAAPAPYARILGFNQRGRALLREMKARFPLVNAGERPADEAYYALETRASDLYSLFSAAGPRPAGEEDRLRVCITEGRRPNI